MSIKTFILSIFAMTIVIAASAQEPASKKYCFTVSFNSIGTGVPQSKQLADYILKFKRSHKVKSITADHIGPLGREGEYKLGFNLKELTPKQKKLFLSKLQTVVDSMKDRGSATLKLNDKIKLSELSTRATITKEMF